MKSTHATIVAMLIAALVIAPVGVVSARPIDPPPDTMYRVNFTYINSTGIARPCVFAAYDLYRSSTGSPGSYTFTGSTGHSTTSGWIEAYVTGGYYYQVKVYSDDNYAVKIATSNQNAYYWWSAGRYVATYNVITAPAVQIPFDASGAVKGGEVWMAYDMIRVAHDWLYTNSGVWYSCPQTLVLYPDMPWPHNWPYTGTDGVIHINNNWHMTYKWVVQHEYGHRIHIARGMAFIMPYGDHDLGTGFDWAEQAFAEGWADFFACVVNGNSNVIVSVWSENPTVWKNVDWNTWSEHEHPGNNDGGCCEGSVAGLWWDMFDGYDVPGDADNYQTSFSNFWHVWHDHHPDTVCGAQDDFNALWNQHWPSSALNALYDRANFW
ncbi:MAG: hypothetical protein LUO79_07585 [Methanomassiliicoccales archaeon]|nr:hypothetical protein [Methanomassiliicoccales archaeon]